MGLVRCRAAELTRARPALQVVFRPLLSHTGAESQAAVPLRCRVHFGQHLSFSGALDCLRADIVDSDTAKDRRGARARRCVCPCRSARAPPLRRPLRVRCSRGSSLTPEWQVRRPAFGLFLYYVGT